MRCRTLTVAWFAIGIMLWLSVRAWGQEAAPQAETEGILAVIQGWDDAWNRGDGEGWAKYYAEDGEFINILGTVFGGRHAIEQHDSEILSTTFKGSKVESRLRRVQWLLPDAAVVDTDFDVRNFERLPRRLPRVWPDGSMRHRLKHVMVRRDGRWLIVATQNTPLMPPQS